MPASVINKVPLYLYCLTFGISVPLSPCSSEVTFTDWLAAGGGAAGSAGLFLLLRNLRWCSKKNTLMHLHRIVSKLEK